MQRFEHERRMNSGGESAMFTPHNRVFIAFRVVPFWVAAVVFAVLALAVG